MLTPELQREILDFYEQRYPDLQLKAINKLSSGRGFYLTIEAQFFPYVIKDSRRITTFEKSSSGAQSGLVHTRNPLDGSRQVAEVVRIMKHIQKGNRRTAEVLLQVRWLERHTALSPTEWEN